MLFNEDLKFLITLSYAGLYVYLCPIQAFVEAVISRLRSTVDEDVFIPLYPKKSVSFCLLILMKTSKKSVKNSIIVIPLWYNTHLCSLR